LIEINVRNVLKVLDLILVCCTGFSFLIKCLSCNSLIIQPLWLDLCYLLTLLTYNKILLLLQVFQTIVLWHSTRFLLFYEFADVDFIGLVKFELVTLNYWDVGILSWSMLCLWQRLINITVSCALKLLFICLGCAWSNDILLWKCSILNRIRTLIIHFHMIFRIQYNTIIVGKWIAKGIISSTIFVLIVNICKI
jgi:hypothetical protein